jgi:ribosomal protein L10
MIEILKLLPKLTVILGFLKTLPAMINQIQNVLKASEEALVEAGKVTGKDTSALVAGIQQGVDFLESAEDTVASLVGVVQPSPDVK